MVHGHQDNRGENAIMQLVMTEHLITDRGQNSTGAKVCLPRLFRGNFPAAPVESVPMCGIIFESFII